MAFLITSPMINEVAVVLLGSLLGVKFMVIYVAIGLSAGILGGFIIDLLKGDRFLKPLGQRALERSQTEQTGGGGQGVAVAAAVKLTLSRRHRFARQEVKEIFLRVWKWVLIGVGLGAALHGYVPEELITGTLGDGQWWSVPAAVLLGIPLYASASGVIPVAETLLAKGLPVGTTLAFMMSTVAASFPEFMMLKQVMKPRLLGLFFLMLLVFFTLAGWILNLLY